MAGKFRRNRKNSKKTRVKRSKLKRNQKVMTISDLNDDCLIEIFHKLSMDDLLNVAQTSSRFKELAKFVLPKLYLCLTDVKRVYEIYSDLDANNIVQNIRELGIMTLPDEGLSLIEKISKNCTKLQELSLCNRYIELVDRDAIINLCQNITRLHLLWNHMEDSIIKEILSKNNGQLKVLSIQCRVLHSATTFLRDVRNLEKISLDYPWTSFDPISMAEFLDNNCDSLEHLEIRTKTAFLNNTVVSKIASKFHNLKTISICYNDNGTDISPIAKMSTLKRVYVMSDFNQSEAIDTFFDDLAETNSVELFNLYMQGCPNIVGPTRKMDSLKCLVLFESENNWKDFRFENLPELEELSISPLGHKMIGSILKNILLKLPKLKTLHVILTTSNTLKKTQCMALERFLAKHKRKLIFRVDDYVFDQIMENPDNFKFLRIQKMY